MGEVKSRKGTQLPPPKKKKKKRRKIAIPIPDSEKEMRRGNMKVKRMKKRQTGKIKRQAQTATETG